MPIEKKRQPRKSRVLTDERRDLDASVPNDIQPFGSVVSDTTAVQPEPTGEVEKRPDREQPDEGNDGPSKDEIQSGAESAGQKPPDAGADGGIGNGSTEKDGGRMDGVDVESKGDSGDDKGKRQPDRKRNTRRKVVRKIYIINGNDRRGKRSKRYRISDSESSDESVRNSDEDSESDSANSDPPEKTKGGVRKMARRTKQPKKVRVKTPESDTEEEEDSEPESPRRPMFTAPSFRFI